MIQEAFKIVELENGEIKTLFHGINNSRTMPTGVWLEADEKIVRDGSGDRYYISGWHTLPTYEDCVKYMSRFKNRTDILTIVPCEIKDIRLKDHSKSPVNLSKYIKF
jgi:hypothetical protein